MQTVFALGVKPSTRKKMRKVFAKVEIYRIFAHRKLSDGVTGNTSGFGPEESRFEP